MALKGKMVIGQSGGPTTVINQSLVGAILEARKHEAITGILGARHGIAGIMKEDFIDLTTQSGSDLECLANTPAAGLGSVRLKPGKAECERVFEVFLVLHIAFLDGQCCWDVVHPCGYSEGYLFLVRPVVS